MIYLVGNEYQNGAVLATVVGTVVGTVVANSKLGLATVVTAGCMMLLLMVGRQLWPPSLTGTD